jgi:hypothetical protein
MGFCSNCGASLAEGNQFCVSCGTRVSSQAIAATVGGSAAVPPPPPPIEVTVSPGPLWHVGYATGQIGGPFTEDEVRSMIARQQIKITDSVVAHGGTNWVPITQSPFARLIVAQASVDRLASSTCPRCGAAMVVILRRSTASKVFFIVGLLTIWMFGFGIIFLIIGYIVGRNPIPGYECARCKYKAS